MRADLIDLWKDALRKQTGLGSRHLGTIVEDVAIVQKCGRCLVGTMGGQSGGGTSLATHDVDIQTSLPVRSEGYLFAVRTPYGVGVIGRMGSQLLGCSTSGRHCEQVSFVGECYGLPVRRYGWEAHP